MAAEHKNKRMRCDGGENVNVAEKSAQVDNENRNENEAIVLPYDVVSIIFKHLCAKDLCSCAVVCRLWQEAAVDELGSRGPIINLAPWEDVFRACHVQSFPCNLTNKPMLGFLFNGGNSVPRDCFSKHFPRNCVSLLMNTNGLMINGKEYENCSSKIAYGYLPESSEVQMEYIMGKSGQVIHLNKNLEMLSNGDERHSLSTIEPMFQGAIDRLKEVKCMLLITTDDFGHQDKVCGLKVIKENISAMWGGIARKVLFLKGNEDGTNKSNRMHWVAVLIGGPNVKSWSIIIDNATRRKERVRERFIEFRKNIELKKHTVALMFSCVGRGQAMYHEADVEAGLFKEIFPDIPLVGGFGNGEFGFNYNDKRLQRPANHQYSTSLLILTYD